MAKTIKRKVKTGKVSYDIKKGVIKVPFTFQKKDGDQDELPWGTHEVGLMLDPQSEQDVEGQTKMFSTEEFFDFKADIRRVAFVLTRGSATLEVEQDSKSIGGYKVLCNAECVMKSKRLTDLPVGRETEEDEELNGDGGDEEES